MSDRSHGTRRLIALFGMVLSMLGSAVVTGESGDTSSVLPEFVYAADRDANTEVDAARARAVDSGKLLLVAFGAQWCHDSRGLSRNFSDPSLLPLLRDRFEIVFVDLGYYDQARSLFQSFGMPVFFGTPTVLVIDPVTQTVLNEDTLARWQAADSVPMDEYRRYFGGEFSTPPAQDDMPGLAAVRAWERQQAERLYAAYDVIGPMLAAEAEGRAPAEIDAVWGEVRDFRMKLQRDLVELRAAARNGESFAGDYRWPTYPRFSWES